MLKKYAVLLSPDAAAGTPPLINPPAADPAVEPPTPEQPAEEPDQEEEPEQDAEADPPEPPPSGKEDPLLAALFRDLGDGEPEIKPVPEEKAEEKPDEKKTEAPAKPEAEKPAEEKKPAKKARKTVIDEIEAPPPVQPAQAPPPAPALPPTPPPPDPDEQYVSGLTEEQKDELAEAEVAERLFPDRYRGRKKALINWYRSVDTTATRLMAEDPNRTLDDDDEFKKFLRTKPKLDSVASKRIQRTIGKEEAVKEVTQRYEPKLAELDRKQQEIEFKPRAESLVSQVTDAFSKTAQADDKSTFSIALKAAQEKGEEGWKGFELERDIYESEVRELSDLTGEYAYFARKLRKYDPTNPTHVKLLDFINSQESGFARSGGPLLQRDGKQWTTRSQFMNMPPEDRARHWSFGHRDVMEMLVMQADSNIKSRLAAEEAKAQRLGFARAPKAESAAEQNPPKKEPKPIKPPQSLPKIAKPGSKPKLTTAGDPIDIVSTLRLND